LGQADGACDSAVDCVCDPDCGVDNQPPDPDCEKSASSAGKNNTIFIIAGLIILIIIIVIAVVVISLKRKNNNQNSENEEDFSTEYDQDQSQDQDG